MVQTEAKKTVSLKLKSREAGVFKRRIGQTTYRVGIHFSDTSRETMDEKIIRLIQNEAADGKAAINQ